MIEHIEVGLEGPGVFGRMAFEAPDAIEAPQGAPWRLRPRVEVAIDQSVSLACVVDQAAVRFGLTVINGEEPVSSRIDGIAFGSQGDFTLMFSPWDVILGLDADGGAVWGTIRELPAAAFVRAAERGLHKVNPQRLLLYARPPGSGGPLGLDWNDYLDALRLVAEIVGGLDLARRGADRLKALCGSAPTLMEEVSKALIPRGAGPLQLLEAVRKLDHDWVVHESELSKLLGVSVKSARQLLETAGYERRGASSEWERRDTLDSLFVSDLWAGLIVASMRDDRTPEAVAADVREILAAGAELSPDALSLLSAVRNETGVAPSVAGVLPIERAYNDPGYSMEYRVVAVPVPLASAADFEALLNAEATLGWSIESILVNEALRDGTRVHLVVLAR